MPVIVMPVIVMPVIVMPVIVMLVIVITFHHQHNLVFKVFLVMSGIPMLACVNTW